MSKQGDMGAHEIKVQTSVYDREATTVKAWHFFKERFL